MALPLVGHEDTVLTYYYKALNHAEVFALVGNAEVILPSGAQQLASGIRSLLYESTRLAFRYIYLHADC